MNVVTAVELEPPAMAKVSEESGLVEVVQRGDQGAFERLYSRYARMVTAFCSRESLARRWTTWCRMCSSRFIRRLNTLRDRAAFGGWLAMITRNRATDFHRRSRETVEIEEHLMAETAPRHGAEAQAAVAAVKNLPEAYRETLILRLVEGMTGAEIAAHRLDARFRPGELASGYETAS